jgi:hypothetical protein
VAVKVAVGDGPAVGGLVAVLVGEGVVVWVGCGVAVAVGIAGVAVAVGKVVAIGAAGESWALDPAADMASAVVVRGMDRPAAWLSVEPTVVTAITRIRASPTQPSGSSRLLVGTGSGSPHQLIRLLRITQRG